MAIFLKIEHVEGLRLRQQVAQSVLRAKTGEVQKGSEWVFERDPLSRKEAEVPRDLDPRTRIPLNTYSPSVNHGTKNLVIDKKGAPASVSFRNGSLRNQLRIKLQALERVKKDKEGKDILAWKDIGAPQYVPPQTVAGVTVGDGVRAFIDEMPT